MREDLEKILFDKLGVINIKLPLVKNEDIVVGSSFFHYDAEAGCVDKLTITYTRSGIVFYTSGLHQEEDSFPMGCIMQRYLEPEVIETELNPKHYKLIPKLGKTKIVYK